MILIENQEKLKMNMKYNYKFCILSAGRGTRNRSIEGLHKALLPLENKAVISRILNNIPKEVEVVIPVGYKSDQIKSYLKITHSNRKITFVKIKNFDGKGSGPGLSLLLCKEYLQCPFIFMSVDTVTEESYNYNEVNNNWVGVANVDERKASMYCLVDGETYLNKFYWGVGEKAFCGIAGIYEYEKFWKDLNHALMYKNEFQVLSGFDNLENIRLKYFTWYDTGNEDAYAKTKNRFCREIEVPKNNEVLFIDGNNVIKYFSDSVKVDNRIARKEFLNGTIPEIYRVDYNMYGYKYIKGKTLSKIYDDNVFAKLLSYWYEKLGSKQFNKDIKFLRNCEYMYYDKTHERCEPFSHQEIDNIEYINGMKVEKIYDLLKKVNWDSIYKTAIPSYFHGDFQPENIIYDNEKFTFIDWRESFGDNLEIGDFYYDLGKLYHASLINGNDVNNKLYRISIKDKNANISYHSRSNLLFLYAELKRFCKSNNYSWSNIRILGALQYLGISSLYNEFHNGDYGKFLFLYGKYLLTKLTN